VFRDALAEFGLQYAVGIQSSTSVWPPGRAPLPAESSKGRRPRSLQRRVPGHDPVPVKELALALEPSCYHTVSWREGTRAALSSRSAAVRIRSSHRDYWRATRRDEEWLLIEWPTGDPEQTKYWLSTLAENAFVQGLVHFAKMRWRIERDYQDLK
jgi:SRSO17 transposase